jgi:chloride channel protein, CIC family
MIIGTYYRKLVKTEHLYIIILSIITGLSGGIAAIAVRVLINKISYIVFPGEGLLLDKLYVLPWYFVVFMPALGGLIVGPIIYYFAKEAKGHGVPQVIKSIKSDDGKIRSRVSIVKAITSSITIGMGGSAGREGPMIQIGASIGSTIGQIFNLSPKRTKTLLACGAAAGVAAAFNAPIGGMLFALEVLLMEYSADKLIPVAFSSVVATALSRFIDGNFALFPFRDYVLASPYELIFYIILGVLAGIISYLFIFILHYSEFIFDEKIKIPGYLKPAIGGLLVGCIGFFYPNVIRMGYESISLALQGKIIISLALVLVFAKIVATSFTLGSGGSGGIFAPALFIGAMLGCVFGGIVSGLFPGITAGPGAYALVAMAGLVAGTTRAPITAFIIVVELTLDYDIILPLVIVCVISMYVSSKFTSESIFTFKFTPARDRFRE